MDQILVDTQTYYSCLEHEELPQQWKKSITVCIYKMVITLTIVIIEE